MTTSDSYAAPITDPLFDGDTGKFTLPLRQLLVRLLRGPYLDGSTDPSAWQLLLDQQQGISDYFSEIFLALRLDMDRKIAMLAPVQIEQVHTSPIAPRRPLKRDETLLALRLRLLLEQHSGSGSDAMASGSGCAASAASRTVRRASVTSTTSRSFLGGREGYSAVA